MRYLVMLFLFLLPVPVLADDSCDAMESYVVGLVRARDVGKTRAEADRYALERVPEATRPALRLAASLRGKLQEAVYTDPSFTEAQARLAAQMGCR